MATIKATIVSDKSKDLDHGQKGTLEEEYIAQLSPIEKKAYKIAIEHLGTSFNLKKSNGFCDWQRDKNKK
jgi:hypothetical protein